jgi:hypothetical protein
MPKLSSDHWDEKEGVCLKHLLPMIPCPACAAEKNESVEVYFDQMDEDVAASEKIPLSDLLPENFTWVRQRC